MTTFTFIYSDSSVEPFRNLVNSILELNECDLKVDDVFFYGVFCDPCTYIRFPWVDHLDDEDVDIPEILLHSNEIIEAKRRLVENTMKGLMMGTIKEKPEWMMLAESETCEDDLINEPSTFLFIIPKDKKYEDLGKKLKDFLYSPKTITEFRD